MKLNCINIATTQTIEMRDFYSLVFLVPYKEIVPNRFEICINEITLVITHTDTKTPINPDCCGLEFIVDDVDAQYTRLLEAGIQINGTPVTYPWKWRAFGFKDPDGNNIDFVQYVG